MSIIIAVAAILVLSVNAIAGEPNESFSCQQTVKSAVIICKGMIDDGLYQSIRRRTQAAIDGGAKYLIYEISTYGGLVDAADNISKYLILDAAKKAHTVAYITTEAISAGAMISVSCRDIIMLANTTIGDCAPIAMGEKLDGIEREKAESFIRATFDRAAESNGYPPVLLKAMVSMQTEVYRIKNLETGILEFFEGDRLPKDPNTYNLADKELIDRNTELLTLTASRAFEYGIARAVVKNRAGVLDFLSKRDGVTFAGEPSELETSWSEELVRWLNSPAVMGILVMLALLGIYIEFHAPGAVLPAATAIICFAIIIGSKYLVGLANWVEIALFVTGIILLLAEIFVIPGFGIAGVAGIILVLAGLFGMLIRNTPNQVPWPQTEFDWQLFINEVLGLFSGFAAFLFFAWLISKYLPKSQVFNRLVLTPAVPANGRGAEAAVSAPSLSEGIKVGDCGEIISTLRPAGKARFGDSIVDVVAEAEFIDKGTIVRIAEISGNKVVVKEFKD